MPSSVIVGLQWGDEGKGKITDLLAQKSHYIVRYQGGNNAGHSLKIEDKSFVLHLIPSGVIHPGKKCLIASGVVIDPKCLLEELSQLREKGIDDSFVYIDMRAHLTLPYHKLLDEYKEEYLGNSSIGTTKRGIGPTYEDKMARTGIRVIDLLDKKKLEEKIIKNSLYKNKIITGVYQKPSFNYKEIIKQYHFFADQLRPRIIDGIKELHRALGEGKNILFEGAQALLLDIDYGTYPYVTTSSPSTGGVCIGAGVPPTSLKNLIGVAKAYSTRVGEGAFPTELQNEEGEKLREIGHEYGATTGRKRRCGWLDLVALRYAIAINGINQLVITKLDVLSSFEQIKICMAYQDQKGHLTTDFPASTEQLAQLKPLYKEFSGWKEDISKIRTYEELPKNCKKYLEAIEKELDLKISLISVGPERNQNIVKEKGVF